MIHVYGTSHVSEESMELINEKLEQHDPDIVAIELDLTRLNALLNGDESTSGAPVFIRLVKRFQDYIGSKTGVMPGDEMLYAYQKSVAENREVALIDRDIRATVERLKTVPRKEKVRAVAEAFIGFLRGDEFDVSRIPEEELVDEILDDLEHRFPELHRVLVEERNQVMADYLRNLQQEEPDAGIVAFVGAAHSKELQRLVE